MKLIIAIFRTYITIGLAMMGVAVIIWTYSKLPLTAAVMFILGLAFAIVAEMDWKEWKRRND